jgi:hypothetical protein
MSQQLKTLEREKPLERMILLIHFTHKFSLKNTVISLIQNLKLILLTDPDLPVEIDPPTIYRGICNVC